ncbi:MAG: hypothetical protein HQ514_04035 [Rhodospirillales bacterium]|nr:hypothetical protein [Rhodospirillales bacterium]
MTITVEVSYGEMLDKISILEIKLEKVTDAGKRANIARELDILSRARDQGFAGGPDFGAVYKQLKDVNVQLWEIEDDIRDCERRQEFGDEFIALARSVYRINDRRAALKRELNDLLGSPLVEEKLYREY